jgi:REP element-mobilizing transposase RayT
MARPLRLEFPGALYHVTSRGSTIERHGWVLHAFCLMGNHYHLQLETPQPNLSRGMRQLNGVYTQRFNRRHQRVGHVLQGRFTAILVERESYLLELVRYVPLNPVRAGFVPSAEQWQWSSYRAAAGFELPPSWLSITAVLERFGPDPNQAALRFREFVFRGSGLAGPWEALRGQILGSETFAQRMLPQKCAATVSSEVPRRYRWAGRPQLASLFPPETVQDREQRNVGIVLAHRLHGYSLAEIARHLGLHYSTVSRVAQAGDASIQDLTPA